MLGHYGSVLGVPYQLLGGTVRERIPAYANGWYTVERKADDFRTAARSVVERGYRALKLDPFGAGFYELSRADTRRSVELVEAVQVSCWSIQKSSLKCTDGSTR